MWVFLWSVCLCTMRATLTGQKRVLDFLELELQMVANHQEGAGNESHVLYKGSQGS